MNRILTALLVLSISTMSVWAQSLHTTDATSDFDRGYTMYCSGNYTGCFDIMSSILQRNDAKQYHEEAAFYAAMSQAQRAIDRTPELLDGYIKEYPYSIHRNEINLALGYYYYNTQEYSKAIEQLLKIDVGNIESSEQDDYCHHLALCFLNTGQPEKALPLLQALTQNSQHYRNEAQYHCGYVYYEREDYKSARRHLSQVHSGSEYGLDAQYLLLNIDFSNELYAQCVASCRQLLDDTDAKKYESDLYRIAGESHYQLGNDSQANIYLTKHLETCATPLRYTLYMTGIVSYRNKQYDRAIELLSRVTEADDEMSQNAFLHKGLAFLYLEDYRNASVALGMAAEHNHNNSTRETALYNQALCAYIGNLDLFGSTLSLFQQFAKEYPHSIYIDNVNKHISDLYINNRNYASAIDYIDRIKQPSREQLKQRQQMLYLLGTEHFANNSISEAAQWFTQAIKAGNHAPEYKARSLYWLGECCYRKGAYNEALKCYNQFINSNITTDATILSLAHYNIAYCHFELGNYDKARSSFDHFVKLKGNTKQLIIDANSRIGDCYFHDEEYATAEKYYATAANKNGTGSDYALLQQAIATGLNKNYTKKTKLLQKLIDQYPQSEYGEEGHSELGNTYISLNKHTEAINTYKALIEKYPMSSSARIAMLQTGALYYNLKDIDNAIAAYKNLIIQQPTSNEAKVAVEDLQSIYIEQNQIDDLLAFMQQQNIDYHKDEIDSLTYIAAEKKYMTQADTKPFEKYVSSYPNGAYADKAYYYLGNVADTEQRYETALSHYRNALRANPTGQFAEIATTRSADILLLQKQYEQAAAYYTQLENIASSPENRLAARLGAMRSYAQLHRNHEVIELCDRLLNNGNISPEIEQEVIYNQAKAYLCNDNEEKALVNFISLSQDTRSQYGAEAAYIIAQHYFDKKQIDEAEAAANDFVQKGTPHAYWLARNFILLADIHIAKGDNYSAQQYLTQLRDNYPGQDDDIIALIEKRLETI